jgi:hypothetical protein
LKLSDWKPVLYRARLRRAASRRAAPRLPASGETSETSEPLQAAWARGDTREPLQAACELATTQASFQRRQQRLTMAAHTHIHTHAVSQAASGQKLALPVIVLLGLLPLRPLVL